MTTHKKKAQQLTHNTHPYQIFRWESSPYWSQDFHQKEKVVIDDFGVFSLVAKWDQLLDPQFDLTPLIWITNTHSPIEKMPPQLFNRTKLIIHLNSGYDNFSVDFVKSSHFPIIYAPTLRATGVCEYYLSCLMHNFAPLPFVQSWDHSRKWNRQLLSDQKIFIMGYGHVGKLLHQTLSALNQSITVYDPYLPQPLEGTHPTGTFVNDLKLISHQNKYSVICLTAGLNPSSKNFFNQEFWESRVSDNFVLINAARSPLINWDDLLRMMAKFPKASAYLDVFPVEPYDFQNTKLNLNKNYPNIFKTSHIAGVDQNLESRSLHFLKTILNNLITLNDGQFLNHYSTTSLKQKIDPTGTFLI
jgi:D-3-phosphoglycerate dehydrogenase